MAKKSTPIEPIDTNPRFAAASAILRALLEGERQVERERDALIIEGHLASRPQDPRRADMTARLKKLRAAAPRDIPANDPALAPPVAAALELVRGAKAPRRVDRGTLIAQIEDDRYVIRLGIITQHAVVDAIHAELSGEVNMRLRETQRALVLQRFRAEQALAAAWGEELALKRNVVQAGYAWRPDLLPSPSARAGLILGSESDFDSEISRTRRMLEELNVL
jgi:hypothetical protein